MPLAKESTHSYRGYFPGDFRLERWLEELSSYKIVGLRTFTDKIVGQFGLSEALTINGVLLDLVSEYSLGGVKEFSRAGAVAPSGL
jgi:hypothetical protein